MNPMNHLKKLVVLSSLALSFAIHADGTLPLPRALQDGTLPLAMSGEAREGVPTTATESNLGVAMSLNMPNPGSAIDPALKTCASGEKFFPAGGTVDTVNAKAEEVSYEIKGLCAPLDSSNNHRQIVAVNRGSKASFDGTFDTRTKTFNGALKLTHGALNFSDAEPGEPLDRAKLVKYELRLNVN